MKYCSINYKIIKENDAKISINERGFLFGDGVFETCLVNSGKIYNFLAHFKRLQSGIKSIKIDFDLSKLEENIYKLIAKGNIKNSLIRIYISRGIGSLGYLPKKDIQPLITIQERDLPKKNNDPIDLYLGKITKISKKSLPINNKIAQGLNSTLAKMEAEENNCFDSILLNEDDEICETSSANIFWVKDKILYTPHQDCGILSGTMRQKIIDLSPIKVIETKSKLAELKAADEVFISNISCKIIKVKKINPNFQEYNSFNYSNILEELIKEDIKKYV